MVAERIERRLAAILAADVVGYSRLMGIDEVGTRARFNDHLDAVIRPAVEDHGGRVVNTMGDGVLVEFASVVNAVHCATAIQTATLAREADRPENGRMLIRIGVHLGDVVVEGEDIHGDGVNIAARLEQLAPPGGICVSDMVHAGVRNKLPVAFEDAGEQSLKNIADPLRVYRVVLDAAGAGQAPSSAGALSRPAVAVLPFANLSGDPDQEFFADGLTEDLIAALSLWRTFPVIARTSTFAYKGKPQDIRQVGAALGARYVVEGSVRKAGERIRVAVQLGNAETGHQVWVEHYDRELGDIFALQDEITQSVAAIVEPTLERTEHGRIAAQPPHDLAAWELWLKGYEHIYEGSEPANRQARALFERAIAIDPTYARAHVGLAYTYVKDLRYFGRSAEAAILDGLFASARKAIELDATDSEARAMLARACMFAGQFEASIAEARRAVHLNPHHAFSNQVLGNMLTIAGRFEEGIEWLSRAQRLNPLDPQGHLYVTHLALAHLGAGRFDRAAALAEEAIRMQPDFNEPHVLLAAALGHLGRPEEAAAIARRLAKPAPEFVESERPYWSDTTKQPVIEGLRKAGIDGN